VVRGGGGECVMGDRDGGGMWEIRCGWCIFWRYVNGMEKYFGS
jgi:hypothetical protein